MHEGLEPAAPVRGLMALSKQHFSCAPAALAQAVLSSHDVAAVSKQAEHMLCSVAVQCLRWACRKKHFMLYIVRQATLL